MSLLFFSLLPCVLLLFFSRRLAFAWLGGYVGLFFAWVVVSPQINILSSQESGLLLLLPVGFILGMWGSFALLPKTLSSSMAKGQRIFVLLAIPLFMCMVWPYPLVEGAARMGLHRVSGHLLRMGIVLSQEAEDRIFTSTPEELKEWMLVSMLQARVTPWRKADNIQYPGDILWKLSAAKDPERKYYRDNKNTRLR